MKQYEIIRALSIEELVGTLNSYNLNEQEKVIYIGQYNETIAIPTTFEVKTIEETLYVAIIEREVK